VANPYLLQAHTILRDIWKVVHVNPPKTKKEYCYQLEKLFHHVDIVKPVHFGKSDYKSPYILSNYDFVTIYEYHKNPQDNRLGFTHGMIHYVFNMIMFYFSCFTRSCIIKKNNSTSSKILRVVSDESRFIDLSD
jgi:hypothetical protein